MTPPGGPTKKTPPPPPSFAYVAPGVHFAGSTKWSFVVLHKGPDPVFNVDIMMKDQDKIDDLNARGLPMMNPDEFIQRMRLAEVDASPGNSTPMFFWDPFRHDVSHFKASIGTREMHYDEDASISLVPSGYAYAIKLRESQSGKVVFECSDQQTPGNTLPRCFPYTDGIAAKPEGGTDKAASNPRHRRPSLQRASVPTEPGQP